MYIWKNKEGKKLTLSEVMTAWGEGIKMITPLQLTFQQLIGQIIIIIGVICGLVVTFMYEQWWIFTILVGSLIVTVTGLIGILQKYGILKQFSFPTSVNNTPKKEVLPKYV